MTPRTAPTPLRAVVLMAVLTLAWGGNWPVMKIGATLLPPLWFRAIGLALGTVLLGLVLLARGTSLRLSPRMAGRVVGIAIPNIVVWYAAVTIGVTLLPAGRAAILGFTMPAWTAVIGALFYRQTLDGRTRLGVACAVAGVLLLVSDDLGALTSHPLGAGLMLTAAIAWAWGTHLLKRAAPVLAGIDTLALTFWLMLAGLPFIVAASALLEGARWTMPHGAAWGPIAYNAVLVLAVGNVIWFTVARSLPPVAAGLSSMLIPVVGVFSGMWLLGETPGWRDFAALALIAVAVLVGLVPRRASGVAA